MISLKLSQISAILEMILDNLADVQMLWQLKFDLCRKPNLSYCNSWQIVAFLFQKRHFVCYLRLHGSA